VAPPSAPEKVARGVYRVDAFGLSNAINVLLIEGGDGWTLIDTGVEGSVGRIKAALATLAAGPEDLKRVFLTHQHDDHAGGLGGILEWAPHAEVASTEHEAAVISGRRGYDPASSPFLRFMARNAEPPGVPVGKVVREGDLVAGFRVVATPGHTPGHVSLLRDEDGVLFTADAFGCLPKKIRVGVREGLCVDPALARRSARKLVRENFGTAVFAHGETLRSWAKQRLRGVAADCRY
jgi:glyoxylase-like metal-dependent hydrolase (beta-lactamase superfamily II)